MYVQKNAKLLENSLMNFHTVHTHLTINQIKQDITSAPENPSVSPFQTGGSHDPNF